MVAENHNHFLFHHIFVIKNCFYCLIQNCTLSYGNICNICCQDNLCNNQCTIKNPHHHITMTTTTTTTTTTPTTTTTRPTTTTPTTTTTQPTTTTTTPTTTTTTQTTTTPTTTTPGTQVFVVCVCVSQGVFLSLKTNSQGFYLNCIHPSSFVNVRYSLYFYR